MADLERQKRELLDRIEVLLEEANALPRIRASWERRTEIEWQILQLCRHIANLSSAPPPYWACEEGEADGGAATPNGTSSVPARPGRR